MPRNWHEFLRDNRNKTELFLFLGETIVAYDCNKVLVSTLGKDVSTNKPQDLKIEDLKGCTHEGADTRIILHAKHAENSGYKNVVVRTVDTDVLVLLISNACL